MTARAKAFDLAAQVAKLNKKAPVAELAEALGALMARKPARPAPRAVPYGESSVWYSDTWGTEAAMDPSSGRGSPPKAKRRAMRRGRTQQIATTGKWNDARRGTFRHYMIAIMQAATNTHDAEKAHYVSDQHVGKKLDFSWAAANGYITLT